ncbi:MAG: glycosyltransferase family 39 protein, partial [bacterium]|nr:glycosyltransferase family 39 protein [bacterium]
MKKTWTLIFASIFLFALSFILRLYKIDNPVADWHSWRQADTAAVSRNFIKNGFTPLFPRFDSLETLKDGGIENPERYFFAEFPIYNILTYPFYKNFGVNEIYARLVNIFFSSLTAVALFLLCRLFTKDKIAFTAGLFFAIIPYNIYYGRVIMPDPLHVFFIVTTFLSYVYYLKKSPQPIYLVLAGIAYAGALLTKPYALVLLLPLFALAWQKYRWQWWRQLSTWLPLIIALIPFALWRYHVAQYPEGSFGTAWLFNSTNIRFTGAFWRWLIAERLNRIILGIGGFVLVIIGLFFNREKAKSSFFYWWLLAVWIFFIVIATGNVTHDYYQLPIVPSLCFFAATGFWAIIDLGKNVFNKILYAGGALALVLMMLAFGWYEVRGFFNINNPAIVAAG